MSTDNHGLDIGMTTRQATLSRSSAHAWFANHAPKLIDNGYLPLPLDGKKPAIQGWNSFGSYSDRRLEALVQKFADHNVGIRTGEVLAVDIDLTEPGPAHMVGSLAMEILGGTDFVRIGNWPKRALLYRADTPSAKQVIGKVELLGDGQQLAIAGIHPGTGAAYHWPIESPLDCPLDQLPIAARSSLDEFLDAAARLQGLDAPLTKVASGAHAGRNAELFSRLKERAAHTESLDHLEQQAEQINQTLSPPLKASEVAQTVKSVWKYIQEGRLMLKGQQSTVLPFGPDMALEFRSAPHAYCLYGYLRGFGAKDHFTVPQKHTANKFGWGKDKVRQAIERLIAAGLIEPAQAKQKTAGHFQPKWYRFPSRR